ncbi:hypothetical protein SOVF_116170 [Spinacia oleracea]|nr:hypothetical protein SOVF_116170 [Spinacia oleracea]
MHSTKGQRKVQSTRYSPVIWYFCSYFFVQSHKLTDVQQPVVEPDIPSERISIIEKTISMNQYTRKNRRTCKLAHSGTKKSEEALHLDDPLHLEESAQLGTKKSDEALHLEEPTQTETNQSDEALHLDPGNIVPNHTMQRYSENMLVLQDILKLGSSNL